MSKENTNLNAAPTSFIGESSLEGGESASMAAPAFNLTAGGDTPPSQLQADPSAPVQMQEGGEETTEAAEPLLTDAKATAGVTWNNNKEFRIDWVRNLQLELLGARTSTDGSFDVATIHAVAAFQDAQELGVDGKIGQGTRRRLEQVYPNLLTTVVGDNLNERVLIPAGADTQAKYNYYRGIVEGAGGVFLTGAGEMNLVGIRGIEVREDGSLWQSDSAAEFAATRGPAGGTSTHLQASTAGGGAAHDDYIVSLWMVADDAGNLTPEVREREGSVDPASAYNGAERPGTAHLRDGQYAYKTGRHGTRSGTHIGAIDGIKNDEGARDQLNVTGSGGYRQYNALVPTRNQEVWRESRARGTNDLHLDAREEAASQEAIYRGNDDYINDNFAINIHTSREDAGNSVACQNVPADEYLDFMTEINGSTNTDNILYTLIDASKIENGLVLETQTEQ